MIFLMSCPNSSTAERRRRFAARPTTGGCRVNLPTRPPATSQPFRKRQSFDPAVAAVPYRIQFLGGYGSLYGVFETTAGAWHTRLGRMRYRTALWKLFGWEKPCPAKAVNGNSLESEVREQIKRWARRPGRAPDTLERQLTEERASGKPERRLAAWQNRACQLEKARRHAMELYEEEPLTRQELNEDLQRIAAKKVDVVAQITEVEKRIADRASDQAGVDQPDVRLSLRTRSAFGYHPCGA